jgi:Lrp/AsnC family transcriptional regulator, leucine-responsive regulatory protein
MFDQAIADRHARPPGAQDSVTALASACKNALPMRRLSSIRRWPERLLSGDFVQIASKLDIDDIVHPYVPDPNMKISRRSEAINGPDELDSKIIDILRTNGRATNQEIAERLSVTAATVSARLRRLEDAKAVRVVAVSDFAAHGYKILIAVGVKVFGRDAGEVARDLAKLPEVFSIHMMSGPIDLEILVVLREFEEINVFLQDHVARIPGVYELHPAIAADIVKFEFNVAPL